jgi:peroxiredoxin/outer membrane lipoprotein-sorting protein
MLNRPRLIIAIALGCAAAGAARSAEDHNPRRILDNVARTYRGLSSFHFQGEVGVDMSRAGAHQAMSFPILAAAAKPNRSRTEMQGAIMGMIIVNDGQTLITYAQQLNQFTKKAAPLPNPAADSAGAIAGPASPLARYFTIARSLRDAHWRGERALELSGKRVMCDVVEADYEHPAAMNASYSPTTFWIERARSIVLRESTHVHVEGAEQGGAADLAQTTTYSIARVNEKLPDSLWVFHPPAGATEVSSFQTETTPDLSGQKAADFTLTDLSGKSLKLSTLRGKVVLLDFWATWCGPCRIEMPNIQKIHHEFKDKGLVVLGINQGETAKVVQPFLKRNGFDFRILLDQARSVSQKYQVSGIPTRFIIDKEGTIRAHFVGVRDEATLREALAKAGIQ